ncbi:MAG: TraB/VirB10 family protein, partial [Alphaproteobacteria bacterium]|nr:TraB/VirB10 family protein [Alphaproteobacteria bacterium]
AKEEKAAEPDGPSTPEETLAAYLPAGSMVTGVLVTGMDAATGKGAMRDPMPALFRVKHEAILPNRFRSDIRECFMMLGGYGDLSAERAMLRGETISCVRKDGRILEANLPAYAVGEDGKVGVRGRLVSKTGQLLANALMAGFAEGVSKAFDVRPIPVISTTPSSTTQYQGSFSAESAQSAAVGGMGSALDRIAQFYIDMAGETFPVVEVDAGRRIDLILSKGVPLKFMDPTKKMTPDTAMPGVPAAAMTVMPPGMAPLMGAANAAQQSGFFRFGQTLPR